MDEELYKVVWRMWNDPRGIHSETWRGFERACHNRELLSNNKHVMWAKLYEWVNGYWKRAI